MEENHFACSSKDCNLRFSNENILKIHKKKHEMVLSLVKPTLPVSDQTPTPTRFIRNCDEVGLFQELRNVNPFEETFRKAAEAVRTGAPPQLNISCAVDDTLHTPHVFPNLIELETLPKASVGSIHIDAVHPSHEPILEKVVRQEADTSHKINSPKQQYELDLDGRMTVRNSPSLALNGKTILDEKTSEQNNVQVLLKMPDGTFLQLSTKPVDMKSIPIATSIVEPTNVTNNNTVILSPQNLATPQQLPLDSSSLVKQKLKQALLNSSKPSSVAVANKVAVPSLPPVAAQAGNSNSTMVNKCNSVKKIGSPASRRDSTNSDQDSSEDRRRKALERNRAAAMRCRERRKAWVADLGRKADLMTATNQALIAEVTSLRAEVCRLKALLLTHRDCPVTLAAIAQGGCGLMNGGMEIESGNCTKREAPSSGGREKRRAREETDGEDEVVVVLTKRSSKRTALAPLLQLDIAGARVSAGLGGGGESPIVLSDRVLTSVAPSTPPIADQMTFSDEQHNLDIDSQVHESEIEERTPVIQLNPNVLRTSSGYS